MMQVSFAAVVRFLSDPVPPRQPHPGQPCDMDGPSTRCSICTGLIERQDPITGEWLTYPLPAWRKHT
jgi:hypothetical protein